MKAKDKPALAAQQKDDVATLVLEVRELIASARHAAASTVNTLQVLTNFEIGRRIVEHEQKGKERAKYGTELLKELSSRLTEEFGRGFSRSNLEYMRKFFLVWSDRFSQISQQPTGKLDIGGIQQQPTAKLPLLDKFQQATKIFALPQNHQTLSVKLQSPFTLSWTHYVLLLTIKNPDERSFYEIEATNQGWSVPELKRQKASAVYERLALSRDKDGIRKLAAEGQIVTKPEDVLTHQDLGQMQMYVNYFDRYVKLPDENPTIGLLLCKSKKDTVVELTLPEKTNIHAREYQLYLPSKELLKKKLIEWTLQAESELPV